MEVMEDSNAWFEAQQVELLQKATMDSAMVSAVRWEAPREGFVKCNVGVSWSKEAV